MGRDCARDRPGRPVQKLREGRWTRPQPPPRMNKARDGSVPLSGIGRTDGPDERRTMLASPLMVTGSLILSGFLQVPPPMADSAQSAEFRGRRDEILAR